MSFNAGDKVTVNSGVVATILSYDEDTNLVRYRQDLPGGGTDTVTAHISLTRLELIEAAPDAEGDETPVGVDETE